MCFWFANARGGDRNAKNIPFPRTLPPPQTSAQYLFLYILSLATDRIIFKLQVHSILENSVLHNSTLLSFILFSPIFLLSSSFNRKKTWEGAAPLILNTLPTFNLPTPWQMSTLSRFPLYFVKRKIRRKNRILHIKA